MLYMLLQTFCPFFHRNYLHYRNLVDHIRIAHKGLGHECTHCKRRFSSRRRLAHHASVFHSENASTSIQKLSSSTAQVDCGGDDAQREASATREAPNLSQGDGLKTPRARPKVTRKDKGSHKAAMAAVLTRAEIAPHEHQSLLSAPEKFTVEQLEKEISENKEVLQSFGLEDDDDDTGAELCRINKVARGKKRVTRILEESDDELS